MDKNREGKDIKSLKTKTSILEQMRITKEVSVLENQDLVKTIVTKIKLNLETIPRLKDLFKQYQKEMKSE